MTTYRQIHGKAIKSLSTDPSDDAVAGQIWYNTTSNTFKSVLLSAAWSAGSSLITGRYNLAGSGTQTAGLVAGGTTPGIVQNTEEYNGGGWATGGALTVGRDSATMFGLQTAAAFVGGYAPSPNGFRALVEEYNGSSWSEQTNVPAPRAQGASAGTQTDGIIFGGNQGPPASPETTSTTTLEYDGTNWTTGGAMSVNDRYLMGCGGSQAQALRIGGESDTDATEEYNGASWTTGGNLNTGRYQGAASGTNTAGLVFGGNPNRTNSESYDGTSWTNTSVLATGVEDTSGSAQGTNAEAFQAGQSASPISKVQDWNSSSYVITAAAFSSGGTVPQIVRGGASGGTQTAAWLTGGLQYPGDTKDKTWTYDGSSWSSAEDLPNNYFIGGGVGPATAGLAWDGIGSYGPGTATYEWDGSNWTSGGAIPAIGPGGNSFATGAGVGQTAAVAMGGIGDPPPAKSDRMISYNGASWSSDESLPAGVAGCAADGPNTAI